MELTRLPLAVKKPVEHSVVSNSTFNIQTKRQCCGKLILRPWGIEVKITAQTSLCLRIGEVKLRRAPVKRKKRSGKFTQARIDIQFSYSKQLRYTVLAQI